MPRTVADEARHEFSQSPPGKAGFCISSDLQVAKAYTPALNGAAGWFAIRGTRHLWPGLPKNASLNIAQTILEKIIVIIQYIIFFLSARSAESGESTSVDYDQDSAQTVWAAAVSQTETRNNFRFMAPHHSIFR
jgi:hypothetical protein